MRFVHNPQVLLHDMQRGSHEPIAGPVMIGNKKIESAGAVYRLAMLCDLAIRIMKGLAIQASCSMLSISRTKRLTKRYERNISSGRSQTDSRAIPGHPLQPFDRRLIPLHGLLYPSQLPA